MSRHGGAMFKDKTRTRPSRQLLGILWIYLRVFKKKLIGISIIILIYTMMATYQPILIRDALNLLINNPSSNKFTTIVGIFFILSILVWFFQSLNTWIMADIRTKLVHELRTNTFDSLSRADMAYHHKNQSGNITSRVVSDTQEIATGLAVFTTTATQLMLIVATLGVLIYINPIFILIAFLAVPLAIIISKVFGTIGKKRMLETRQAFGHVSGKLSENLAGVAISKAFNQEERVSAEIKKLNDKSYEYLKKLLLVFIIIFPTISMISTILVFAVLITGGYLNLAIGDIYLGTIMVQRFLQPIMQLANNYTQLQASLAAVDRVADVLEAKPSVTNSSEAKPLQMNGGKINFDSVSFEYEKGIPVLSNISFDVPAGKKVALVGHTGAGKTTITSLLMRFYDPISGSISIDDQELRHVTLESVYDNLSLVNQEPYLFADTVLENIRYGKPDATDEDIFELCAILGADQFILALPEGYQTLLQESGKSLSAGQKQMITIARTMLSDPKILILDEATSRLDAYSESLVQFAQKLLFEGRTTLIIAHRLSTIRDVDKIIVLENGIIKEMGNHDDLMLNKSIYYELYNMYYAHQGLGPLDMEVLEKSEDDLIEIFKEKIEKYKEAANLTIIDNTNGDKLNLDLEINEISELLDQILNGMLKMAKMTDKSCSIILKLERNNGSVEISVIDKRMKLPPKMLEIMKNPSEMSHGNQPKISDLVEELNGSLEIKSPVEESETGIQYLLRFPMKIKAK